MWSCIYIYISFLLLSMTPCNNRLLTTIYFEINLINKSCLMKSNCGQLNSNACVWQLIEIIKMNQNVRSIKKKLETTLYQQQCFCLWLDWKCHISDNFKHQTRYNPKIVLCGLTSFFIYNIIIIILLIIRVMKSKF
jgi:hypothetical protein